MDENVPLKGMSFSKGHIQELLRSVLLPLLILEQCNISSY